MSVTKSLEELSSSIAESLKRDQKKNDVPGKEIPKISPQELPRVSDSVVSEVTPELRSIEDAEKLENSLLDRLRDRRDEAIDAAGRFDEDRLRKLLED